MQELNRPTAIDWLAVPTDGCPIARAVGVLGDRWSLLILRELAFGVDRFDAVQEHLAISRRTLTERLDALVAAQVAERTPYKEPGQRTRKRYRLTAAGHEVLPLLLALGAWGERYGQDGAASPLRMNHAGCGRAVRPKLVCTAGHEVGIDEVQPQLRRPR